MQGWVKLHRKLAEWEWYDDIPTRLVFIDLLIRASHKERKWQGLLLTKGSLVTTYDEIAERNKLTYDVARNTVKKLVNTHVITKQKTHNKLLINVLNYGKYQGNDSVEKGSFHHTNNTQLPNECQTDTNQSPNGHHTLLINKNEKNVKNDKNITTAAMSEFDWSRYSQRDMTEQYPLCSLNITVAQYDVLFRTIPENALNKYIFKASNYKNIKSAFDTIIAWAKEDGII